MQKIVIHEESLGIDVTYEVPEGVLNYIESLEELIITLDEERQEQINTFYIN